MRTIQEMVDRAVAQRRFQMEVAGGFGIAALLLAALGIYGVVAYAVALRRCVRMALGPRRRSALAGVTPRAAAVDCRLARRTRCRARSWTLGSLSAVLRCAHRPLDAQWGPPLRSPRSRSPRAWGPLIALRRLIRRAFCATSDEFYRAGATFLKLCRCASRTPPRERS
jgi:hypothetical protein